jgi:hypothetical protein
MRATRLGAIALTALAVGAVCAAPAAASMELEKFEFEPSSFKAGEHPEIDVGVAVNGGSGEVLEKVTWIPTPGFILEPQSVPNCTSFSACQPGTQVGVVTVHGEHEGNPNFLFGTAPVYQFTPFSGQYLRLGFTVPTVGLQVEGGASLPIEPERMGLQITAPYQMRLSFDQLPQSEPLTSIKMTLWAVPAADAHDEERFPAGSPGCPGSETTSCLTEPHQVNLPEAPLTLDANYCVPGNTNLSNWSVFFPWSTYQGYEPDPLVNIVWAAGHCAPVGFSPSLTVAPTTTAGHSKTGLVFDVKDPQDLSPTGVTQSELQSAVVATPGLTLDQSLPAHPVCEDSEAAISDNRPSACPEASRIGTVEFKYAGLSDPILGETFLGKTVNGKTRLFVVGVGERLELKLLGTVEELISERLRFTFGAQPRLPITEEKFEFEPDLVRTPVHCGEYVVEGSLAPWEPNQTTATPEPQYTISTGPGGSPCIGLPASVSVKLDPESILADGSSQTTATIAVRDADGNGVPAEGVQLSSSDPQQTIGPVVDNEDGTYSAVITGSANAGPSTITATDASANPKITGSATLMQVVPSQGGPSPSVAPPPPPPTPHVKLVKKPAKRGTNRRPRIEFSADVAGATFACRLDRGPFKPCTSPFTPLKLSLGRHTFSVRAADGAVVGPTTTWPFKVVRHKHRQPHRHRRG